MLIIDEWLLLKPTEAEQHDILELLHRRRKKSSTIFCAQYDPSGWYDQLGGDDSPLAEAILDRFMHDAYKINIVPTGSLQLSFYERSIRIGSGAERIIVNSQLTSPSWRFYSSGWRLRRIHYLSGTVISSFRTGAFSAPVYPTNGGERTGLPLLDFRKDPLRDLTDHFSGQFNPINILKLVMDISGTETSGIKRDHLIPYAGNIPLVFGDGFQLEFPIAVHEDINLELSIMALRGGRI